jgi:nicotinamidase-related amidase
MKKFFLLILLLLLLSPALFAGQNQPEKKQVRPALIVIDVQNAYLPFMAEKDSKLTYATVNGAIALFRQYDCPVIRVYHTDPKGGPNPGSKGFEFDPAINIRPDDQQIIKNFPSAFKKTDLDQYLRDKGCNTLFLCGLSAVGCVLATYHGALDLDYRVYMLKDGLMSHNSDFTDFVEDAMESVSYYTLKFILESTQE